ncbi:hypothetical protein Pfo_014663 [Paulownia fortunei]|nr:hypothetical protein Pfo_014663 [Paulownia fortunei]
MYSKISPNMMKKRPHEESSIERPRKSPFGVVKVEDDTFGETKIFKFRILLPNGTTVDLKMRELRSAMPIEEFVGVVRKEYRNSTEPKRRINWKYQDLHFTDAHTNKIRIKVNFRDFVPNKWHFLWLHDGSAEPDAYEDMWDLTPDTDLLKELPDDYTFETALADLIDNSLQALWSIDENEKRLISVKLYRNKISIFDSGPGMDGTDGNLVKWGKMGASLNRSVRGQAIGGKPPYLTPFFGMFGYGGPVATMCLGRRAIVSSKTKNCNKVFTLHLEREALMSASRSENCWRTKGGMRDPSEDEKEKSPHGSFTKVEIFEPKMKILDIKHFQCKLKDIYFPYIQCDEMSGKTSRPIEFQVNGKDLLGLQGGEVATTNLHSSNGPDFILQLRFSISQDPSSMLGQSQRVFLEANARLKCVYFPIVEGEESIKRIIDKLDADGCGIRESYEGFSRVSVRRLGRLLPDARWVSPILKRCCSRVKCFIDTDSGFNPTPYKTDLANNHPYTKALKNFGNRAPENEKEVQIDIFKDGKKFTLSQLEKQYNEWILEMHDCYDEEIDGGLDEPTLIVVSSKIKKLGITSDVLRVHKKIQRRGTCWTSGQKIKVLKGACPGCHKTNVFATLQYIILEGLPGMLVVRLDWFAGMPFSVEVETLYKPLFRKFPYDRPLGLPEGKGCHLLVENGNKTIDIRESLALPIRIIDSEKCVPVDDIEWENKLETYCQKLPSAIDLLSHINCQELEIEGGLPTAVEAGDAPPENIVAVIRPKAFNSENSSKRLDQKFIVRDNLEMTLEVKFRACDKNVGKYDHIYSARISPSSHKGLHGLYLFPVKLKCPYVFQKAGFYTFSFSLNELRDVCFEQVVQVQASAEVGSWKVVSHKLDALYTVRVDSCFEPLSVACHDRYRNCVLFTSVPKLSIKLSSSSKTLARVRSMKVGVTTDKSIMIVKDIVVKSSELDDIRPNYEATLNISTLDEAFSVAFPCRVIPGTPRRITVHPPKLRKQLIPGQILEELALEVFDEYGNHAKEHENIYISVDGFSFQDGSSIVHDVGINCIKKVDANGYVDLSNILKVSKGYGKDVFLCVISKERAIFKLNFRTEMRELRAMTKIFKNCEAGSQLENIVFEIINSEGKVDESIHDEEKHGQSHTLTIKSNSFDIDDSARYSFRYGRCAIRSIPLPHTEGIFSFSAAHSRYPELNSDVEVHVEKAWRENRGHIGNHEDVGNPVLSPQISCENLLILPQSPSFKVSEVAHKSFSRQSTNGYVLPIGYSPSLKTPKFEHTDAQNENSDKLPIQALASQDLRNLASSALICPKELEDDLANCGTTVIDCDRKLEMLNDHRSHIQQLISDLEASVDRGNVLSTCGKELTLKQIESKSRSAAAVICKLLEEVPFESRPQDILGVVALLGTVESIELSRMLAQYLGDDQMRAIVCTNYAAACCLENNTLHEFATKFGQSISGGYLALCLEDIRPSIREPSRDPQKLLPFEIPTLPNGNVPQGFLGYAANMISIEASHLHWRTKSGHGLRETLFFRLFGEIQVYKDRECMMMARSCIKDGAVSLDGGIMRGNGLVSLGHWEPDIIFPVKNKAATPQSLQNLHLLEAKRLELIEINQQMDEENKSYSRARKKLLMSRDRYNSYVSQNGPSSAAGSSQHRNG